MYSYTFKAIAKYQEKDNLREFIFSTYATSVEKAYADIENNANRVCCEYHNLRLVKITTIADKEEYRVLIWEEIEGRNEYKVLDKPLEVGKELETYSYTFNALSRYQEKDKLEQSKFNTYATSVEKAYRDIKDNADRVCCEYLNLRLVKITTVVLAEKDRVLIWEEKDSIKEQLVYSKPLYVTIQVKKHKSKRINKKWIKEYGFREVRNARKGGIVA
jgi:hypothetical protein